MSESNFYYVYELPTRDRMANGFCHSGGNPIPFLNVDWFEDAGPVWGKEHQSAEQIEAFVKSKKYVRDGLRYLVIGSPGHSFVFETAGAKQ
ncbi:hypothetical protein OF122_13145 [Pelagibacterium flavum]|uniref:Uncharacterized protein n=1 Tax=Pelagibacterium flavum TaxID=2984530 RepID=A0ABY6IKA0_9HYPH|nr:hypothetical protein [Pelagibacterium sp. YIM 151497]UYQ71005.1 hypothetical protein OF122_13145 [Pelagibacterium sp. YIM 151497]